MRGKRPSGTFREEMERRLSDWLDLPVPVRVRQNARAKSVILRVTPERGLEITTPAAFDLAGLPYAVQEKLAWIENTVATMLEDGRLPGSVAAPRPSRLVLTAFSLEYAIRYLDADRAGGCAARQMGPGEILVKGPLADGEAVCAALARFARKQATPLLVAGLREVSREIGLPFACAGVRAQRTRWGSCTAKKRISLNLKLAFLPWSLARYVFIHELCHTIHLNHSGEFWKLVAAHEPDCAILDKALRHAEEYVPVWMRLGLTAR